MPIVPDRLDDGQMAFDMNLLHEALAGEVGRLGPESFEFGGGCCDCAAALARQRWTW